MSFLLTPAAYQDLLAIGRYTEQKWGRSQRNHYLHALTERFSLLAKQPSLGKNRIDVAPSYYSFAYAEHVIFYLQQSECIAIIGIVHRRADPLHHFSL